MTVQHVVSPLIVGNKKYGSIAVISSNHHIPPVCHPGIGIFDPFHNIRNMLKKMGI
jgi:hypothetical protein